MSIIKCPECGHQISDKAPACPQCGIEIAGKVTRCPQCGEVYFKSQERCPKCHHLNTDQQASATPSAPAQPSAPAGNEPTTHAPVPPVPPTAPTTTQPNRPERNKKTGLIITCLIIAIAITGTLFYFYNDSKNAKEQEAYEYALQSGDPLILQQYLDQFGDAPAAHTEAVESRLKNLRQIEQEWTNAVVSGSATSLADYLRNYPNSPHKAEAIHRIDSIDWEYAYNENSMEALQSYLDEHANGEHVDEANAAIKRLKAKTVQPDEKERLTTILRGFFQSLNTRNESGLTNSVATIMTSFLGKNDATKSDVVTFMNKIYKDDVTGMNWQMNNDMKIDKKEVGDEKYEYTIQFSAIQDVQKADETENNKFRINAKVGPDGKISSFNLVRIIE